MEVTEQQRHQLFVWFEERMGPERAATMMNLIPPIGWFELASKDDVRVLQGDLLDLERRIDLCFEAADARMDSKLDRLRSDMMRTFGTWLFTSQAAVVGTLGLLITLR